MALPAVGATPIPGTDVTITATGLRSAKGKLMACLTADPGQFPNCRNPDRTYHLVVPAGETVELHFADVPPGRYAVALLHDENGNGKIDRALMLVPTEGFGFSSDAPVVMGPPKFEAAAFTVAAQPVRQTIHIRYIL
jgi:uncharacterized protein (DUF2141 family)